MDSTGEVTEHSDRFGMTPRLCVVEWVERDIVLRGQ